jgi:hypothetical protein
MGIVCTLQIMEELKMKIRGREGIDNFLYSTLEKGKGQKVRNR